MIDRASNGEQGLRLVAAPWCKWPHLHALVTCISPPPSWAATPPRHGIARLHTCSGNSYSSVPGFTRGGFLLSSCIMQTAAHDRHAPPHVCSSTGTASSHGAGAAKAQAWLGATEHTSRLG